MPTDGWSISGFELEEEPKALLQKIKFNDKITVAKENVEDIQKQLKQIMIDLDVKSNNFYLKSFAIELSISAKGKLGFNFAGAEISGTASIKLNFERRL